MSVTGHLRTNGFMEQKRSDGGGVPALLIGRPPPRTQRQGGANIAKTSMEPRGIAVRFGVSQSARKSHGSLQQRNRHDGRPASVWPEGRLLRRKPDREGASQDDR